MPSRARAKGEGTIVKRKDGRFEGRLSFSTKGRKRRRPVVYGKTKAEVAAKLRKLRARYAKGASDLTVGDYLREWLADGCSRWEPQTYRTYLACLAHVISRMGERKVSSLVPADIKVLLRLMQDDGVGNGTEVLTP